MPGDTIGDYTLLESIGLGGTATVFRASSERLGIVAVKILHPGKLTEVDVKRFKREFEAMHRLEHPNIIRVYEIGQHGQYPWLSMELIAGGDLNTFIAQWNDPSAPASNKYQQIHSVMHQLCSALHCVHQNDLIHRDLKPSNVLMTASGIPKLTDFGGVKNTSQTVVTELTKLGSLVGTVAFMAPEQILGEELDHRSDLYTLGAMLYMSLTGQKPLEAATMAEYLAKHLYEEPQHPCERNPEIPQYLGDLCITLLQKAPEDRLESAKSVQRFLQQAKNTQIPIGLETPVRQFTAWQSSQNRSITLLHGKKGVGAQQMLQYLWATWQSQDLTVLKDPIHLNELSGSTVLLWTSANPVPNELFASIEGLDNKASIQLVTIHPKAYQQLIDRLQWPSQTIVLNPIALGDVHQLLQAYGVTGPLNQTLGEQLHHVYRGFLDYLIDFLEHHTDWLQAQLLKPKSTDNTVVYSIPVSPKASRDSEEIWAGLPSKYQPFLAGLIVYQHPISLTILPKLWNGSTSQTQNILHHLEQMGFIIQQDDDIDSQVHFTPWILHQILYNILPGPLKSAWHQRIARFIAQKRRLRSDDRTHIIHHLTAIGDVQNALPHYESLILSAGKREDWTQVKHWLNQLNDHQLSPITPLQIWEIAEQAYAATEDYQSAIYYNQKVQAIATPTTSGKAHAYLYYHTQQDHLTDDDRIDPILLDLDMNSSRHQQIVHIRALQHLVFNRRDKAAQLWQQLQYRPHSTWTHRAEIGMAILTDIQTEEDDFLSLMASHPEQHYSLWHQWYCERLITTARWHQLEQYLAKRIAFGLGDLDDDIFAAWYDYLTGNATRAQERLAQIKPQLPVNPNGNMCTLIHYHRLCRCLKVPSDPSSLAHALPTSRIENYPQQCDILLQIDTSTEIDTPIFWQRDFALLDLARGETSELVREQLWNKLSSSSWGIQLQLSKIFSDSSKNPTWSEKHRHTLEKCARNRTGDFHAWH